MKQYRYAKAMVALAVFAIAGYTENGQAASDVRERVDKVSTSTALTARNSSPRLKLVVVKTLPYPVINSRTPGAEEIPGGFEGGNTVKVIVRGKSEYHLFAHSYQTLDWSHCRMDHWVSADGLHWRHDKVLVPPYTDKVTGLWTLSCSPMPFFDTKADRWQIYYALFAKPQQNWSSGGTLRCASSKVKGRDGISGPYDFPGEEVLKPGVGYPKTASVNSVSTPFLAKDGKWLVFYGGDNFSALLPDTKTWGKWWVALASAPSPRGPYTQLGNEPQPLIAPTGFNENPMPIRIRGPKSGKDYWVATFDFLHGEVAGPNLSEIGFTWSSDGRDWPAEHGQAVDIRAGFNAGEKPWWHVVRTPHDLIDEGDGTFTCFFTATSEDDHGFRGIGMVKFKIEEATDGFAKRRDAKSAEGKHPTQANLAERAQRGAQRGGAQRGRIFTLYIVDWRSVIGKDAGDGTTCQNPSGRGAAPCLRAWA